MLVNEKVFEDFPDLVHGVRRDGPRDTIEEFVCRLYRAQDPKAVINKCRTELFEKGNKCLEKLPPTDDALILHVVRANHLAKVWLQANLSWQTVGLPSEMVEGCVDNKTVYTVRRSATRAHVKGTKLARNALLYAHVMRKDAKTLTVQNRT